MIVPTETQINAGFAAARAAIEAYSSFDNSMIPDDALMTVVEAVASAILNAQPVKGTKP